MGAFDPRSHRVRVEGQAHQQVCQSLGREALVEDDREIRREAFGGTDQERRIPRRGDDHERRVRRRLRARPLEQQHAHQAHHEQPAEEHFRHARGRSGQEDRQPAQCHRHDVQREHRARGAQPEAGQAVRGVVTPAAENRPAGAPASVRDQGRVEDRQPHDDDRHHPCGTQRQLGRRVLDSHHGQSEAQQQRTRRRP